MTWHVACPSVVVLRPMSDTTAPNAFRKQAETILADLDRAVDGLCEMAEAEAEAAAGRARAEAEADAQVAHQIGQAELESEIHNRMSVVAELQSATEKLLQARAEADALRLQLHRATHNGAGRATPEQVCTALDTMLVALSALEEATGAKSLFAAVVDAFAGHFSRVALFSEESGDFVVWRSRGFDPPLQRKTRLHVEANSPLARAAANWTTASTRPADGKTTRGVLGTPVRFAVALPVVAKGRGTAILYAENPPDSPTTIDDRVTAKIAEILAQAVRSRLPIKQAPEAVEPVPAKERRARRVKMLDGTTVVIDNGTGTLVDLSSLGAQVLSSDTLHPNSDVRLVLPTEVGGITCRAQIVWVVAEQPKNSRSALYRAGMQFTDVKTGELDGFLEFLDSPIRH